MSNRVLALEGLLLEPSSGRRSEGLAVLESFLLGAARAFERLHEQSRPAAAIGRVRGTGPNVSFGRLVETLERDLPIELSSPFEGVDSISGGAWIAGEVGLDRDDALAKLCFRRGTDELPLHVHEHSDRFIMVLEGRGFYHVADDEPVGSVRTVPIRSRDALAFTRGVAHTFSCPAEPLTLLSVQAPYIPFDHPEQYRICEPHWTPSSTELDRGRVGCDPAWTILTAARTPVAELDAVAERSDR